MTVEQQIEKIFQLLNSPVTTNQMLAHQLWKSQNLALSGLEVFQHQGALTHPRKLFYLSVLENRFSIIKWGKSQFWRLFSICEDALNIAMKEQWSQTQATLLLSQKEHHAQAVFYCAGVGTNFHLIEKYIQYLTPLDKFGLKHFFSQVFKVHGVRYGREVTSATRLLTIRRKSNFPINYWLEPYDAHQQKIHLQIFYEAFV